MQLNAGNPCQLRDLANIFQWRIHEHPGLLNSSRKFHNDLARALRLNSPGAFGKDETQGVCACFYAQQGIFQAGGAADFDPSHSLPRERTGCSAPGACEPTSEINWRSFSPGESAYMSDSPIRNA